MTDRPKIVTMEQRGPVFSKTCLEHSGLTEARVAHWNYSTGQLYEQALHRGEGQLSSAGALVALTGANTGRSPKDRFFVQDGTTRDNIWWGDANQPVSPELFERLYGRIRAYLQGRDIFIQDLHAGADPEHRLNVRIITERAWHALFARNMFIRPQKEELGEFTPDFTVIQAPGFRAIPEIDGTRSGVFIITDFTRRIVLIGGTEYAGEIKKSIFTVLNYLLPEKGVLPMHCSVTTDEDNNSAIFFGLSGTGKTTLSADPTRTLIGDDEHGWTGEGVYNFEGGCYAKVINLSQKAEPEIWATTKRFGTIMENVVIDPDTRKPDFADGSITENTRASYPLHFIPNASETGIGGQPTNIIMLTADAFGVLPPVAMLTPDQAMYHFLSGYTARIPGTEAGVTEPVATFSTCFGAPFMPRHPAEYARLLGQKIEQHKVACWLVNTGWTGGAYGTGTRMKISHTRAMIRAILEGKLEGITFTSDPIFGLAIPDSCPDVPGEVLQPRQVWSNKEAYDATARDVAKRFEKNFTRFIDQVDDKVKKAAIRAAA